MSSDFDPYRKWLGIRDPGRPPNHYQLLGVGLFEDDPDVIANAVDRQMSYVRTFAEGVHADLSQRILNELTGAKICLLQLAKKQAYDFDLQKLLANRTVSLVAAADSDPSAAKPLDQQASGDFSPYHKWLGIRNPARRPNNYQLLGLELFEDDRDTIAHAADRQISYIRTLAEGEHADLSQRILNELAAAKVCLLQPAKKLAYDFDLQKMLVDRAVSPVPATNAEPPAVRSLEQQHASGDFPIMSKAPIRLEPTRPRNQQSVPATPVMTPPPRLPSRAHRNSSRTRILNGVVGSFVLTIGVLLTLLVSWNTRLPTSATEMRSLEIDPAARPAALADSSPAPEQLRASEAPHNPPPPAIAPFSANQARAYQETWARYLDTQVETVNSVGARMILIPPGEFLMGSTDEQAEATAAEAASEVGVKIGAQSIKDYIQKTEQPQHRVVITKPFIMGATEVTTVQFKKFATMTDYRTEAEKENAAKKPNSATDLRPALSEPGDLPAEAITWNDAVAYCQWLSAQEKVTYRLPTEAEWEYACRAGTTTQYSFGNEVNQLQQYAWYAEGQAGETHVVGTKLPNAFGLHDMHGNMLEWCQDLYEAKWYETAPLIDPTGPSSGGNRMMRGGAWKGSAWHLRSAHRVYAGVSTRNNFNGFRVVRVLYAPATVSVTPQPPVSKVAGGIPAFNQNDTAFRLWMMNVKTERITTFNDPTFRQWLNDVAVLTAEKQVEAVAKKLQELNPGFDGKVTGYDVKSTPKIENGVVTDLRFRTENVFDISAVRALKGLKVLSCNGSKDGRRPFASGILYDLSPLQGMKLTTLYVNFNPVLDLSPLQGMQLSVLSCFGCRKVSDLSPLRDCKSLKTLDVKLTKVTAASVAALQMALPNCKIEWNDPGKANTPLPAASSTN